jgi:hypothetical protein
LIEFKRFIALRSFKWTAPAPMINANYLSAAQMDFAARKIV